MDAAAVEAEAARVWPAAQGRWSRFVLLSAPRCGHGLASVAQIHLGTRQVVLDAEGIAARGLGWALEAILAHEIGHHVRYPGTLATHARMHMIERALIPLEGLSVLNLFTDLLINFTLGEDAGLRAQLAAVYQAFGEETRWRRDPLFAFVLLIYEERWSLAPGALLGEATAGLEATFPGARAEAQLIAQRLLPLGPNLYTQLIYFISSVARYLVPLDEAGEEEAAAGGGLSCRGDDPTAEDWADALVPDAREREAVRRAAREGWLDEAGRDRLGGADSMERRIAHLPGQGSADASLVPEVMAAWYRREAERYLLRPPPQPTLGEAVVPTTLEAWEPGEPVGDIDWPETLREHGPVLGAAQPLRRLRVAEIEGWDVPFWQPRVEIYLDVSGSMPDPRATKNAMTLAAQILTLGATRAGGLARALIYSHEHVRYWSWCRSAVEISRFLMHYVGGGTVFPFEVLAESLDSARRHPPTRAIISDHDFLMNWSESPHHQRIFAEAAASSAPLLLLLHAVSEEQARPFQQAGAQVVTIPQMDDFPAVAARMARALFDRHPGAPPHAPP